MKPQTKVQLHWMVEVAQEIGFAGTERLELHPLTPAAEAWERASVVCAVPVEVIADHVARHFELPLAELAKVESHVVKLVPEKLARRHGVMPLREDDKRLVVATSDPTSLDVEEDLGFACGRTPQFEIAPPSAILDAQAEHYSGGSGPLAARLEDDLIRWSRCSRSPDPRRWTPARWSPRRSSSSRT